MRRSVDGSLHAARSAGLVRLAGSVQPEIASLDQVVRDVHVVVVDERHAAAERRIEGAPIDALQIVFSDIVGGMGLTGEDELHRTASTVQNPREAFGIGEDEIGSLVARESSRESD